jgi:hypothetical protein
MHGKPVAQSRPWQRPDVVGESGSNQLPQTFLWTFLAARTALLAIAAVHYYSLYSSERVGRETSEQVSVELVRQVLVADVADLMVLVRHIEQMTRTDRDMPDPELERVFVIFAEQKRLYDQIRFIDNAGQETLRVDLRDGRAFSVPRSELQNKSARYYLGQRLLDGVARAAGPAADHLHLVDPRGYWLLGPDPSDA